MKKIKFEELQQIERKTSNPYFQTTYLYLNNNLIGAFEKHEHYTIKNTYFVFWYFPEPNQPQGETKSFLSDNIIENLKNGKKWLLNKLNKTLAV